MKFKKDNVILSMIFILLSSFALLVYVFIVTFDIIPKEIHNEPYVSPNESQK
jgi:hypothetical protein